MKNERETAKVTQIAEEPVAIREWALDRYAYGIETEKRKRARVGEAAIVEYAARKTMPAGLSAAPLSAACSSTRARTTLEDREEKEEQERKSWAKRALGGAGPKPLARPGGFGTGTGVKSNRDPLAPRPKNENHSTKSSFDGENSEVGPMCFGQALAHYK